MQLASMEGLTGLTIGKLASDLGMSKAGVFAHFGSKEELQFATLEAASAVFADAVLQPVDTTAPALVRLVQLCDAWLAYVGSNAFAGGCFFAAAAAELDGRPGELRERFLALIQVFLRGLEDLAGEAVRERHLQSKLDVKQLSFELYALVLGTNWSIQLLGDERATARARAVVQRRIDELATQRGRALLAKNEGAQRDPR